MAKSDKSKSPRIVVIGGGTGSFTVLSGLRDSGCKITAIVNMSDDGGSSGMLRDELGVLPPGDARQCLVALARERQQLRALFTHRFRIGGLKGHTFGNLFLAACEDLTGSFEEALDLAGKLLNIQGEVIPVTIKKTRLCVRLRNGLLLYGESQVTASREFRRIGIGRIFLKPRAEANQRAVAAIRAANLVVMAPGNLYSSLIPNLLVAGIPETIAESPARKVYVCNLMTRRGQTDDFLANDFVSELERWAGHPLFNLVIYNTQIPSASLRKLYLGEGRMIRFDRERARPLLKRGVEFLGARLLSGTISAPPQGDPLAHQRSLIRHDSKRLAKVLLSLL